MGSCKFQTSENFWTCPFFGRSSLYQALLNIFQHSVRLTFFWWHCKKSPIKKHFESYFKKYSQNISVERFAIFVQKKAILVTKNFLCMDGYMISGWIQHLQNRKRRTNHSFNLLFWDDITYFQMVTANFQRQLLVSQYFWMQQAHVNWITSRVFPS